MVDNFYISESEILKRALPVENHGGSFVYFLIDADDIVYVGKTNSFMNRVGQHKKSGKVFDSVHFLSVDSVVSDIVESFYIQTLRPKYNGYSRCGIELSSPIKPKDMLDCLLLNFKKRK